MEDNSTDLQSEPSNSCSNLAETSLARLAALLSHSFKLDSKIENQAADVHRRRGRTAMGLLRASMACATQPAQLQRHTSLHGVQTIDVGGKVFVVNTSLPSCGNLSESDTGMLGLLLPQLCLACGTELGGVSRDRCVAPQA